MIRFLHRPFPIIAILALILSAGTTTVAFAQTDVQSSSTANENHPVRRLTVQEARKEVEDFRRFDLTKRAILEDKTEPYGTRVQREKEAKRQAEKCAAAIRKLEVIERSREDGEKDVYPTPFACR